LAVASHSSTLTNIAHSAKGEACLVSSGETLLCSGFLALGPIGPGYRTEQKSDSHSNPDVVQRRADAGAERQAESYCGAHVAFQSASGCSIGFYP
jgi:hypothetical protein